MYIAILYPLDGGLEIFAWISHLGRTKGVFTTESNFARQQRKKRPTFPSMVQDIADSAGRWAVGGGREGGYGIGGAIEVFHESHVLSIQSFNNF